MATLNSIGITDRPTLDVIEEIQTREGEPNASAIVRRALRFYAAKQHPGLIRDLQPSAPAPSPAPAPA